MGKVVPGRKRKRAKRAKHAKRSPRVLTLKLEGADFRPGRIGVPELLILCQHAQSAVNRQAESMEGRTQTQRRGRKLEKVYVECTLELSALRPGSTALGFELAKPQQSLPMVPTFGEDVIGRVMDSIKSLAEGRTEGIDPGVLDSLNSMGEIIDRRRAKSVRWITPQKRGRKRKEVVFDQKVRRRVAEQVRPPTNKPISIEGMVEMADFGPNDQRCRIHPVFGPQIPCSFENDHSDEIYAVLRKPARIEGEATINPNSGRLDSIRVQKVTPLEPLSLGAKHFFNPPDFAELAKMQAVEPLNDIQTLAGGWPDDEEVDQVLEEIYAQRE